MPAVRRKAKRRWPRAAAVALGLAGGCLSAVPPVVPPGWSVHFHQDTPYFYNENTGETTWEQPRPTTTAATATATSASTDDHRAPPASRRERSQRPLARGDGRPSSPSPAGGGGGGGTTRGWFAFGGRNAAKPHEQPETLQSRQQYPQHPQRPQQRWEDHRAAPGAGRPQEQWHAAGDRGWGRSPKGVREREVQGGGGEEVVPVPSRDYARPSRHGWGPAERRGRAWDPLAGSGSGSSRGADEGGRGPAGAVDGEDLSAAAVGHGIAAGSNAAYTAGERAGGSSVGAGAAEEFHSTRPGGVVGGDAVDEQLGGEGWWASSTVGDTDIGGAADTVPAAAGGDARDGAHDPMEQPSGVGGEDTLTDTVTASAAAAAATEATEAAKERAAVPAPAPAPRTSIASENEHLAPAPPAPAAAGDTVDEWFLPSQRQPQQQEANQKPATLEHGAATPAWKELNPDIGAADLPRKGEADGGREGAKVDGSDDGEALLGAHPGVAGSTGGEHADGPGAFALEHQERSSGSQDKQQQQQQQQQHYAGPGVGHEAEGWDWADPWGQADTWGTPAWKTIGAGTEGAPREQPDESVLTPHSSTHPAGSAASTAAGAAAGSGWGYGSGGDVGGEGVDAVAGLAGESAAAAAVAAPGEAGRAGGVGDLAAEGAMRQEEAARASELERALAEARTELEAAHKAEAELRAALKEEEEAKAAALAEAVAAAEKTMAAEAFARRQAGEARENATAAGQWLVTLGLEREELKGQLAVAETNSSSLLEELSALKESAVEAESRANSSEAKLKVALADVEVLDEGLKHFMDGEGQSHRSPRAAPLSWRRVSATYLRPLLPSKLKAPTPEELEALKLNRSLGRALENNTALAEAMSSKDDLIKDLNSRIKQFQLHAVRRKKGYRALKLGLAKLTDEVQAKESMLTILAVCMFGTSSILESMAANLDTQQANIAELVELSREREGKIKALTLELDSGAVSLRDLRESLHRTESALSAVAASFGAREECLQRWKDTAASGAAPGQAGDDEPLGELLHELHAAAGKKFLSPLGLEPSTGAITVAVPRTVDGGVQVGDHGKKRSGFWAGVLDVLCCRRGGGRRS